MKGPGRVRGLAVVLAITASVAPGTARAGVVAIPIRCGETLAGSVNQDVFQFDALAGEVVSITAARAGGGGGSGELRWVLVGPGPRPIVTSGGPTCAGQCEAGPLPTSGTFTIGVFEVPGGLPSGDFNLSLEAVSATANGVACPGTSGIERGHAVTGAIAVEGETDTFSFPGEKAEVLTITVSPVGGGAAFAPQWELFDPAGAPVLTAENAQACPSACDTRPLPASGTFTIKVSEAGFDAAGDYLLLLGERSTTTTSPPPTTTSTIPRSGAPPPYELGLTLRPPRAASAVPEEMGAAVAGTADTVLIGAPHDASAGHDTGLVYVVGVAGGPASPTFGRLLGTLKKPGTPEAGDAFGAAVAVAGNGALVGAPGDDRAAPDGGAAYLFADPAGGTPTVLLPPSPGAGDQFGFSVATLGDDLLVGAPGSGKVHLFRATGEHVRALEDPSGANERFGAAIAALAGNLVAIGAPGVGGTAGRVLLFDAGTGTLALTIQDPLGRPGDEFGFSVASGGANLVAGAPGAGRAFLLGLGVGAVLGTFQPPTPQPGDRFGASIAVAGTDVLIGAPGGGAAYLFDVATAALGAVLRRPEPQADDRFGRAVAAAGSRLLIGAPGDDAGLIDGGAAYLLAGSTLEAVFRKRLSAAAFGASVAAAGSDVLVGAPRGGSGAGSFTRFDAGSGAPGASVESPVAGDPRFGFSIASLGGDLVVGAPFQEGAGGAAAGAAYVFAGAALRAHLAGPNLLAGDQLGFSVATVGPDVLVGAPLAGEQDTGIAYLFDGTSGALRVTFQKPTPLTGDFFGAAVAGEGDQVLVGAPFDSTSAPNAGAVYLFRRDTAILERTLQSPAPAEGDLFGAAVALTARRVVVGAPLADVGASDAGRVYVFDRVTGSLERAIDNPTPARGDQFGHAVAAVGDAVLIGAQLDDTGALDAGAAYLFDAGTGVLLETFVDPAGGAFDHFGSALAAAGSGLLIGAPGPSHAYLFRSIGPASPAGSSSPFAPRAAVQATETGGRCGNGIVEAGEECDDGNSLDLDDCRSNCTRAICCTLDPLLAQRCDDDNPCTDDSLDPATGCTSVPNDRCCNQDADCPSGKCRVCVGCFLYPWDCCERGSTCLRATAECQGTECLAAAYCLCAGGLSCDTGDVPAVPASLFTGACDELRLEESLAPSATPAGRLELRATRSRLLRARRMIRKAAKSTRRMMGRGAVSRGCGKAVLTRMRTVKRAIPRGRHLRQCVLAR